MPHNDLALRNISMDQNYLIGSFYYTWYLNNTMSSPKCPNDMLYTHYRRLLPNYSEIVSKNQALQQQSDLAAIREEYQIYKSLYFRRLYSTLAISAFVLIWTYGKIERILHYLEYEVYIR